MLVEYHSQICQQALRDIFSPRALEIITAANRGQDRIRCQIGHHEYHFDHNAFEEGNAYIEEQRQIVLGVLSAEGEITTAWQAFGRLTHATQDFYAHSNYIPLWAETHPKDQLPSPDQVDPVDPYFLDHPKLASGRVYFWDFVAFIPGLYGIASRIVPQDSHTHMNLDHPGRGPLFPYALEAAIKRTRHEYNFLAENIIAKFGEDTLARFTAHRTASPTSHFLLLTSPQPLATFPHCLRIKYHIAK